MSVLVYNLLSVDLFKNAFVQAGKNGLNNEIKRISFLDCPLPEDITNIGLIKKGDLFINSFYDIRNDEKKLYDIIKVFIDCNCAASFVITEYIKELPHSVKKLCDDNNFPVVFIDFEIPYAEIIKTTMEMILKDQSDTISEMKVEKLLDQNISKISVIEIANDINKFTKNKYASIYLKTPEISQQKKQLLISNIKKITTIEMVNFKNGIIFIINFDKISSCENFIKETEKILLKYFDSYQFGISNAFEKVEEFNTCIKQSLLALEITNVINKNIVYYKDINLYKILYPLKNTIEIEDFYNDMIQPLMNCEGNSDKSDLVNTIEVYLENDGDYKKTSVILNQHENTVRYRIQKAKRILNLENNNFKFIEQISIALKIKNILQQ